MNSKRKGQGEVAVLEQQAKSKEKKPVAAKSPAVGIVQVPRLNIKMMKVQIVGDSPLICNRFSEKVKGDLADRAAGKADKAKGKMDAESVYLGTLYEVPGKKGVYGFPASAFKKAMVSACTQLGKLKKTWTRGAFFVMGNIVPIDGKPHMRTDIGRNPTTRGAVVIHRAEFPEWLCELVIRYNADIITPEQIVNLLNWAGFSSGVGEWRPERDGTYGQFHVE
jgi:hypothetical protein